jgi:hypothetical protein
MFSIYSIIYVILISNFKCLTSINSIGSTADKASAALHDAEMIRYFKEIETLLGEDKAALLRVIAAFIRYVKTKQTYTHE